MDKDKKEELKQKINDIIDKLLFLVDELDDIYQMIDED